MQTRVGHPLRRHDSATNSTATSDAQATTTADVAAFWRALDAGVLLPEATLADVLTVRGTDADGSRYGLGLLLGARNGVVALVGSDAGVSFQSVHDRGRGLTWTVASNTTEGAWPVARTLSEQLAP